MLITFVRSKILDLKSGDKKEGTDAVNHYLQEVARKDSRRVKWVVEYATEDCARRMDEIEAQLVVLDHFRRSDEAVEKRAELRRTEEDFRFLYGLLQVIEALSLEKFARDMSAYLRAQK